MKQTLTGGMPSVFKCGPNEYAQRNVQMVAYTVASAQALTSNSSGNNIPCTGHGVSVNDLIRFTTGTHNRREFFVTEIVDANNFKISYDFPAGDGPASGVTFDHLRLVTLGGDSSGSIPVVSSQGPLVFTRNGSDQEVTEDTTTPGNNIPLPVRETLNWLAKVRHDYASAVTTAAWTELVTSTANPYSELEIFDSSGSVLMLGFGAASSEVEKLLIFPGGNGRVRIKIPSGTRISVKAVDVNASAGQLLINFYG